MPSPPWTPRPRVRAALLDAVAATPVVVLEGLPRSGRTASVRDLAEHLPAPVRWIGSSAAPQPVVSAPRTVVVDDAHRLPSEVLGRLAKQAGERDDVRLVLLGRGTLPLRREELLSDGRLTELTGSLLAWRAHEVEALLLSAGVALPPPAVERLTLGTGGWTGVLVEAVAGLAEEQAPERALERQITAAEARARGLLRAVSPELEPATVADLLQVLGGAQCPPRTRALGLQAGVLVVRDGRVVLAPEAVPALRPGSDPEGRKTWTALARRAAAEQRWVDALVALARLPSDDVARGPVCRAVAAGLTGPVSPEHAARLLDLPEDLVSLSVWTRLGAARASAANGDPVVARGRYEALLSSAVPTEVRRRAEPELAQVGFLAGTAWVDGPAWLRLLNTALRGDPGAVAAAASTSRSAAERFVGQIAELLAEGRRGHFGRPTGELGSWLDALATLLESARRSAYGDPPPVSVLHALAERSSRGGQTWAARAAVAIAELADGTVPPSGWWAATSAARRDPWAECLARLVDGLTWCGLGETHAGARELSASALLADAVGAPVVGVWARVLAVTWAQDTSVDSPSLRQRATKLVLPGALRALGLNGSVPSPRQAIPAGTDGQNDRPGVHLLCLGTPALRLADEAVLPSALKPRHRALLHLLGARCGDRVHRDELVDALWPDTPQPAGVRSLQVAVSAVRQVLARAGQSSALQRDGEAYQLVPGPGLRVDVCEFLLSADQGTQAARRGETSIAELAFQEALDLYRGDLLVGERAADWLLRQRDQLRGRAASAARGLSELRLLAGDPAGAADAAERGLVFDPYDDQLWRTLVAAHQAAGNDAGARRSEERYRQVLADLDVPVE